MQLNFIHGLEVKTLNRKSFIVYSNEIKLGLSFQRLVLAHFEVWKKKGAISVFIFWYRNNRDEAKFLYLSPVFKNITEFEKNEEGFLGKQSRSIYWNSLILENDRNSVILAFRKAKESTLCEPVFELEGDAIEVNEMTDWGSLDLGKEFSTAETLFAIREHLARMEPLYVKFPSLRKREMEENVRLAEKLQRKYDEESGFAKQQKQSHSLSIELPTVGISKGKVKISTLSRVFQNISDIIKSKLNSLDSTIEPTAMLIGVGTSSTVLLVDFEENQAQKDNSIFEERLETSLNSVKHLYSKKRIEAKDKAGDFIDSIKADFSLASKIAASLQSLSPIPEDGIESITVSLPKSSVSITLKPEDRRKMSMVKAYLENYNEEEGKEAVFIGELGEPSGWLTKPDHKFKISTSEGEIISILHTKELDEEIRKRYQTVVQVKALNKKGKWHFVEWILNTDPTNLIK
ncbi:MAG: hypothetical protein SH817_08675 [Leptospira sp.]|nr:hypothetical protein [Leptospira sp.]